MVNRNLKLAILKRFECQADFAAAARIQQSKVSEVIRGRRQLTEQEKLKWAQILEIPPQEAFGN
ncbi:MAG TPA: helix-turn-helix transcriptional regulator [Deltaproteobacteria bacterium]|nr:helix-turn-helix transcriptional regulator [Deltaproteobacteria bacterium]